jgi:hypothetical protein
LIQRHLHAVPPVSTATDLNGDDSQPPDPRANIQQLPASHSDDDDDDGDIDQLPAIHSNDSEFFDTICTPDEDAAVLDGGIDGSDDGGDDGESPEPPPPTTMNAPSAPLHAAMLCRTATHQWLLRFDGACRHNTEKGVKLAYT